MKRDVVRPETRWTISYLLAAIAVFIVVTAAVFTAGAPLSSDDLWWHLSLGEAFAQYGPFGAAPDPLLITASGPPIPHSWLFDVFIHRVDQLWGLPGLRIIHALSCLAIALLVLQIFRHSVSDPILALTGSAVFLTLSLDRLTRMRPDLVSIAACLVLYRLLLADDAPPSRRRVAAAILVILVWANCHALFPLGPFLLFTAIAAWLATPWLSRTNRFTPEQSLWIQRLGGALGLGLIAALLNPRGVTQHLAFLRSAESDELWAVVDDWTPFNPFVWEPLRGAIPFGTWLIADLVLISFLLTALYLGVRFVRAPESLPIESLRLPLLAIAVASIVAIGASSRFLWMAVFPILWLARSLPVAIPAARGRLFAWPALTICLVILATFPNLPMLREFMAGRLGWYLEQDVKRAYPVEGVRFLDSIQAEGNLFARYSSSGFLGYWLEPRMQTLVNASLNFPSDVFRDYFAIANNQGVRPGERFTDVLDRREIDFFFGFGTPKADTFLYSTPDLESETRWRLIHRSLDHAVYQRAAPAQPDSQSRVADYYLEAGIPFDPDRGLDVGLILREHMDWAVEQRMLPVKYEQLLETRARNPRALEHLAIIHLLLGDYQGQVAFDRERLLFSGNVADAQARLIYGLLKLGRTQEALSRADKLATRGHHRLSRRLLDLSSEAKALDTGLGEAMAPARDAWRKKLNALHLVSNREYQTIMRSLLPPPSMADRKHD